MNINHINNVEDLNEGFETLAKGWTATGEFWNTQSCKDTIRSSREFLSGAIVNGNIWLGWYLATGDRHDFELLFIYCDKALRGQGMGKELLLDLLERIRKNATTTVKVSLEVRPSNLPAIQLYENAGFHKILTRPKYYSNGEDAFVYQLVLSP
jgi:ribosomal protein S18 acetylase RimI-like enzyme